VTAGAGISLEVLDAEMRQRGQFVPLWVGSFQQATLGGVVAANYSDCTKLKYGSPRDLVTGLHAVLSDGRLIKAGSKVVKNVSGYDLSKLLIGSLGTLGVITQATVRLRPCTSKNTHWWREYDNLEEAAAQAWEVANGAFAPVSLGVSALPQNNYYALYVHLEGSESEIETQLSRLPEYKLNNPFWHHNRYWRLAVHLPLKNAEKWLHIARELDVVQFSWEAALGTVIAHFDTVEIDVENLRAEAERLGGFLIVERAPAEVKTPELVWGAPRGDWALMKKLKQSYDTANVCAPGRFVGGL
jgi:glycolate oxidase FAD binding subunit